MSAPPRKTYTETFWEAFPYYLSIGMSAEQYWDGDCWLVKSYRDAHDMMMERQSMIGWLQGRYNYEALCAVAPLLHAFAKSGAKPAPYRDSPYPLTKKGIEQKEIEAEKATYERGQEKMKEYVAAMNRKFGMGK